MINILRIALGHVIERGLGQRCLELHDCAGRLGRIGLVVARELEHIRHMHDIFLARIFEALLRLQVVVAVGQSKASGANVGDDHRGVVQIGDRLQSERHVQRQTLQLDNHLLHARAVVGSVDLAQVRLQRSQPGGIDGRHVCARRIEVAGELRRRALRLVVLCRSFFQKGLELRFVGFARGPAAAPAIHRCRDGILRPPGAVGVPVEIVAGIGLAIEIADLYAALSLCY